MKSDLRSDSAETTGSEKVTRTWKRPSDISEIVPRVIIGATLSSTVLLNP